MKLIKVGCLASCNKTKLAYFLSLLKLDFKMSQALKNLAAGNFSNANARPSPCRNIYLLLPSPFLPYSK